MHITAMDKGMLGADAIVAGSAAIAVGAAHGLRLQGSDAVVVCFFGDGAANQGILHEACNLAAVLDAPVVFVCENNQWAISTPAAASTRIADIADRAAGYGFPGVVVDGNDVLARARRSTAEAVAARARRRGPDADRGQELPRHAPFRGHEDRPPRRRRSSTRGARGTRSSRFARTSRRAGVDPRPARAARGSRRGARSRRRSSSRSSSPRPEPAAALEDVYAPADWLTPGGSRERCRERDARADDVARR